MSASYPVRVVSAAELPAFAHVGQHAFNSNWPTDEHLALDRQVFEPERSLAACDGDRMVGTALAYSFGLTLPGGAVVPAAGISAVAVLPTHRRRGILTTLMRRQLDDLAAGGEPVAALFASEAAIYGRYGYGPAADQYSFSVRRGEGQIRPPSAAAWQDPPELRLAEPKQALAELTVVYDAARASRPGMLTRNDAWWNVTLADPEFMRDGTCPLRCVVAEDQSGPRGYALYAAKPEWGTDGMPDQVLWVRELFASDPAAAATLWANLLSRDLVAEVRTRMRPTDDPLPYLLADPRRARARIIDGLWIRLVDLPAALRQRQYARDLALVIEVTDDLLPQNAGRWRLAAGEQQGATCERTSAPAELALPVSALGAAYLGGAALGALAAAGQVAELRAGALAELSAAMRWDVAPWSPSMF